MRLFKFQVIGLVLLFCSCSKNTLNGYYSDYKEINGVAANKHLELNKDRTFSYEESFFSTTHGDVYDPPNIFIGKGRYTVNGKNMTLIFTSKIRKIDKIEVKPISDDKIGEILGYQYHSTDPRFCRIVFQIDENNFHYDRDDFPTIVMANNQLIFKHRITIQTGKEDYIDYNKSMFPLEITLNFGKLLGSFWNEIPQRSFIDYQRIPDEPKDHNNLGEQSLVYSCGFFDEKISIEKPGNYLVKFCFYRNDNQTEDQVITGRRVYLIKKSIGVFEIGNMKKQKKELKNKK